MIDLWPAEWDAYQLLDSGGLEKLERFGSYVLRRPEPQALWSKLLPESEWQKADATFLQEGSHSGTWQTARGFTDPWFVDFRYKGLSMRFRLSLTNFKHVGLFPEQSANWRFIYDTLQHLPQARVLNLFAYTGGASLAARGAGAEVIHCDSIKAVLSWANANMELSRMDGIRWLLEDAFKFVQREVRRVNRFQGIILDPPAWGHGPKGEKWKLEDMVNDLMAGVSQILDPERGFLVFNSYSLGFSPVVLHNLVRTHFPQLPPARIAIAELVLPEPSGRNLPAGIVARFAQP
jgi:23S rRNA (cytosine1962-C5)-methyltransferase